MAHQDKLEFTQQQAVLNQQTLERLNRQCFASSEPAFYSMAELAERWRCSRATVYRKLRAAAAEVMDFAQRGRRGKKIVPTKTVRQIEDRCLRKMPR